MFLSTLCTCFLREKLVRASESPVQLCDPPLCSCWSKLLRLWLSLYSLCECEWSNDDPASDIAAAVAC